MHHRHVSHAPPTRTGATRRLRSTFALAIAAMLALTACTANSGSSGALDDVTTPAPLASGVAD